MSNEYQLADLDDCIDEVVKHYTRVISDALSTMPHQQHQATGVGDAERDRAGELSSDRRF
jgi:hypothetical protein